MINRELGLSENNIFWSWNINWFWITGSKMTVPRLGRRMIDRSSGGGTVVARGGGAVREVGVDRLTFVRDLRYVAGVRVGGVLDHLEPAVGEGDGVGADHHARVVLGLGLLEL